MAQLTMGWSCWWERGRAHRWQLTKCSLRLKQGIWLREEIRCQFLKVWNLLFFIMILMFKIVFFIAKSATVASSHEVVLYNHCSGIFCGRTTLASTPLQYQDSSYLNFQIFLWILGWLLLPITDFLVWIEYNIIIFYVEHILRIIVDYAMLVTTSKFPKFSHLFNLVVYTYASNDLYITLDP